MRLADLETPRLVLDAGRMDANVARLKAHLASLGVRLRPHVKTCKSIEVARGLMEGPSGPITVSTLKEAEQFAADSGAKVGGIRTANQGTIQIFGTDGNDESAPFSPTSTPAKKIRVVSTFEFELK